MLQSNVGLYAPLYLSPHEGHHFLGRLYAFVNACLHISPYFIFILFYYIIPQIIKLHNVFVIPILCFLFVCAATLRALHFSCKSDMATPQAGNFAFTPAIKRITTPQELTAFHRSPAYKSLIGFIQRLGDTVQNRANSVECQASPVRIML